MFKKKSPKGKGTLRSFGPEVLNLCGLLILLGLTHWLLSVVTTDVYLHLNLVAIQDNSM